MSHIDDLIEELCPDGVEHRPLGEIAEYAKGRVDANTLDQATFTGVDNLLADKKGRVDASYAPNSSRVTAYAEGDILLGNIRPYLKKVWLASRAGGCSGDVLAISTRPEHSHRIQPQFLYYLLSADSFFAYNMQHAKGAKMPRGSKDAILRFSIPIPPLRIQQEIVRILDKFTALEAELEARRKQYEHYRAEAFRRLASDSSKWMTLGAVCDRVSTGATPRAGESSFYEAGDVPWLRTNEVVFRDIWDTELRVTERALSETGISLISKDCVIVAISGATAGRSAVNRIPLTTNQHCCNLQVDSSVAYFRYVYHWVRFQYEALKARGRGPRKDLNVRLICEHPIPVPPLDEQRRIADILDKFDALVNDLSVGLPAELGARREQYEYYRDRLLTFKELAA